MGIGRVRIIVLGFTLASATALSAEAPQVSLYRFSDLVVADFNRGELPASRTFNRATQELEFHVDVLVRNTSLDKPRPLLIRGAQFLTRKEVFGVECRDLNRSMENLILKPGVSVRLDCVVRIVASGHNAVASQGADGSLKIPFDTLSADQSIRLPFKVSASEFTR